MARPDLFDSPKPMIRSCLVCGALVSDEKFELKDRDGNVTHQWFAPASRYWTEEGVFCSAQHSLDHYQAKKGKT